MSYAQRARRCVVCGRDFTEEDDVVFCPDCGAPHHRACWQQEGHCHYEAAHGTDLQWRPPEPEPEPDTRPAQEDPADENDGFDEYDRPRQEGNPFFGGVVMTRCPRCGSLTPADEPACRSCGAPLPTPQEQAAQQEAFEKEPLDDSTVGKVGKVVLHRRQYYLPRFLQLKQQGRHVVSWNWAACLLAPYWLAFRKCYLWAIFAACFDLVAGLLTYPMTSRMMEYLAANRVSYYQAMDHFMQTDAFSPAVMLLAQGALLLLIARAIVFGLFGNLIYKKECLKRVARLDAMPAEEANVMVFRLGGVNILAPVLVYYGVALLQNLLSGLL